jgi:hypothetical protein
MESLPGHTDLKRCDSCLRPAEALRRCHDAEICRSCQMLFWIAEVLFDSDVNDESEILYIGLRAAGWHPMGYPRPTAARDGRSGGS